MKIFLVRILSDSDWIRRDTPYLSVFSPNAEKYGPEKTPYFDTFHAVILFAISHMLSEIKYFLFLFTPLFNLNYKNS